MAQKVCKKCRIFTESGECPICKNNNFADSWKGRVSIIDTEKSVIAKKIGIMHKGIYAIKTR